MCLPEYKLNKRQMVQTRVVLGQFVLVIFKLIIFIYSKILILGFCKMQF